ncbi:Asp-tRNA(Asn)/Glu-tRNA(Gln) amidotransferase subunit GatC [haloarchaeon 3A1-DGR]|nr:Asp-tRNA(Asn)/Glu-tRNA(Gln) amidotransferase subunit GatC [haloarchaeon 3A1-DGR]
MSDSPDERSEAAADAADTVDAAEAADATDVDVEDVDHVAGLARVDLEAAEREAFPEQFAEILEYFETLDEVPEFDREAELVNVMRPDEVHEGLTQSEALRNAAETEDGYFRGPRVS